MAEIVDITPDEAMDKATIVTAREQLAGLVSGLVSSWEDARDGNGRKQRWEEYYRLWRGIWSEEDKNRNSERSRMITPALQQAVEAVTSEIESAILDKSHWFDIEDDVADAEQATLKDLRDKLREDVNAADFETAMNQIFLNGSIFGTGIGKLEVSREEELGLAQGVGGVAELTTVERVLVKLKVVMPQQFAIDSAAHSIKEAYGVAHHYPTPTHIIKALQDNGTYYDAEIGGQMAEDALDSDESPSSDSDSVDIIDYHGLVPRGLLRKAREEGLVTDEDEVLDLFVDETPDDDDDLVEAMIVLGNGKLLKAVENPTLTKERLFIAYRHEIVPDQFWGRGVCEKGYNSQKALDASMRARIDGLALTVHPMMGIDATRMPRGFRFAIQPGRSILTTGNPDEVLRPVKFGNMDPNVFTNTSEP